MMITVAEGVCVLRACVLRAGVCMCVCVRACVRVRVHVSLGATVYHL